jgi:protoporphyrinogen IX oxidase
MLWVKAFHLVFLISWFAGLFYLPRLFVYHAMSEDEISNERFKIMERKLLNGIMAPAALLTTAFGLWMLYEYAWIAYSSMLWLHIKLLLVIILLAYHGWCWKIYQDFKHDRNTKSHVFFRWFNEFPVLVLIAITILVIVKPF